MTAEELATYTPQFVYRRLLPYSFYAQRHEEHKNQGGTSAMLRLGKQDSNKEVCLEVMKSEAKLLKALWKDLY